MKHLATPHKRWIQLCIALLLIPFASAQKLSPAKALAFYEGYGYGKALETFQELREQGLDLSPYDRQIADSYYHTAQYKEAADAYARLSARSQDTLDNDLLHRYSISARSSGQSDLADSLMQLIASRSEADQRGVLFVKNRDYRAKIREAGERYALSELGLNSSASDFAPTYWMDSMVFSSNRDTGVVAKRRHLWNNRPFLDLYKVSLAPADDINQVQKLDGLNGSGHESSATFGPEGTVVYFTRNHSREGAMARDPEGVSRLRIYRSYWKEGKWSEPEDLRINGDGFSTAHPALNPDGTVLYFSSDRPGGLGQSDIYQVRVFPNGKLGEPENLGPFINTEGRENFPFCSQKGILYFASDGQPGLGGLDVFAAELVMGGEDHVINLGEPVNGPYDDFSFIIREDRKRGFFASNRPGGKGEDDIYGVKELMPLLFGCYREIEGFIISSKDGTPIANATIDVFRENGEKLGVVPTGSPGRFRFLVSCEDTELTAIGNHQDYLEGRKRFVLNTNESFTTLSLPLRPVIKRAVQGTDLAKYLSLKPIYYDTNQSSIRVDAEEELFKILDYLKDYPDARISIRSHTDSRGNDSYNMELSVIRAQETRRWLIMHGVSPTRIEAQGFGETQLLNECGNGSSCPEAMHDENRRSEFIVTN